MIRQMYQMYAMVVLVKRNEIDTFHMAFINVRIYLLSDELSWHTSAELFEPYRMGPDHWAGGNLYQLQ